jgi:hypothetical protein
MQCHARTNQDKRSCPETVPDRNSRHGSHKICAVWQPLSINERKGDEGIFSFEAMRPRKFGIGISHIVLA